MLNYRLAVLFIAVGLLNSCGLFTSDDNTEPPAPLVDFTPHFQPQLLWTASSSGWSQKYQSHLLPATDGKRLFIASPKGEAQALEISNGKKLWQISTGFSFSGGPGVGENLIVIGTKNGEVIAFSAEDGSQRWQTEVSSEVLSAPQVKEGRVFVRTLDGKLYAFNSREGAKLWVYERSSPMLSLRGVSSPLQAADFVFAGFDNGKVAVLEARSGKVVLEMQVAQPRGRTEIERLVDIDADLRIVGGILYVTAYQGRTAAFDLQNGELRWQRDTSSYAGFTVDDKALYLSDAEGHLLAFDRYTGNSLWKQTKLHARFITSPALLENYLVVGDKEGYLHWLEKENGNFAARVATDDTPFQVSPLVIGNILLALNNKGKIFAFSLTSVEKTL